MPIIWLASYPHGTRRHRHSGQQGVKYARLSFGADLPAWLRCRLDSVDPGIVASICRFWERDAPKRWTGFEIHGLMLLAPRHCMDDPLSPADQEDSFLWSYLRNPGRMLSMQVCRYARLRVPVRTFCCSDGREVKFSRPHSGGWSVGMGK